MSAHAIRVSGLGKKYWRGPDAEARLIARFRKRSTGETIWALRNCSFDLPKGEILGIIGVNGAGKSTLLKILSRITRPNEGRAELYGRIWCAARSRHRISSRTHRPRKCLPQRRDGGNAKGGDQKKIRQHRRFRGSRGVDRHSNKAILEWHEGKAGICRRRPPRAGNHGD